VSSEGGKKKEIIKINKSPGKSGKGTERELVSNKGLKKKMPALLKEISRSEMARFNGEGRHRAFCDRHALEQGAGPTGLFGKTAPWGGDP